MSLTLSEAARTFLGVAFRHHGRSSKSMDCIGLVRQSLILCGRKNVGDVRFYTGEAYKGRLMAAIKAELGEPVAEGPNADVRENDIVCFNFNGEPHHLGVIGRLPYGPLSVIHADSSPSKMQVVEHILDDVWRARIVAVFQGAV